MAAPSPLSPELAALARKQAADRARRALAAGSAREAAHQAAEARKERTEKHCPACGEVKPIEQFHANRARYDGRAAQCAVCSRASMRLRRDPEADRVRSRAWRERHPGYVSPSRRQSSTVVDHTEMTSG